MALPSVAELLNVQEAELAKLQNLLANELDTLKNRDLAQLEQITADKEQTLLRVNQLDQAISQQITLDDLKANADYKEQVEKIVELLIDCKKQNEINGQIINNSQIAMNRFKGMLQKSISNNSMTYDQKGQTSINTNSIGIKA